MERTVLRHEDGVARFKLATKSCSRHGGRVHKRFTWSVIYYEGCCSWVGFIRTTRRSRRIGDLELISTEFELGKPFKPFDQLMGVLPAAHTRYPAFYPLMTDEDSPIIDFYPKHFDLDMNANAHGKQWRCYRGSMPTVYSGNTN